MSSIKNRILEHIGNGSIDIALMELKLLFQNSNYINEIIHQSGRFSELRKKIRLGIISHEFSQVERNQISMSIIEFIDEIQKIKIGDKKFSNELDSFQEEILDNIDNEKRFEQLKGKVKLLEIEKVQLLKNLDKNTGKIELLENQANQLREEIKELIKENSILKYKYEKDINVLKEQLKENPSDYSNELDKLISEGKRDEARKILEKIASKNEETAKSKQIASAKAFYELGLLNEIDLRYADSIKNFEKCYELDSNNPLYILKLGSIYTDIGEYVKAEEVLRKIILPKNFPEHQAKIFSIYLNNIAEVKRNQGKLDEAIDLLKNSISIFEESDIDEKEGIVAILNNLGLAYLDKGQIKKAIESFENAYSLVEKIEINNKVIGQCYNNLAEAYRSSISSLEFEQSNEAVNNRFQKAATYGVKSLEYGRKAHGELHLQLAYYYNTGGLIWLDARQFDLAKKLFHSAMNTLNALFQLRHPLSGKVLVNLVSCNYAIGEYEEGLKNIELCEKICKVYYPKGSQIFEAIASNKKFLIEKMKN